MSKVEKVAVKREPKRKHFYRCEVAPGGQVFEVFSMTEVAKVARRRSEGESMVVFKVEYNFVQAYRHK